MKRKTNIIIGIVIAVVTLALIVTIIVAAVKNGKQPDGPVGPSGNVTTPVDKPKTPDPVIPPIDSDSGTETDRPEDGKPGTGDVHIDVEQPVDGSRDGKPGIDGDVAIIPGVKGEDE